MPQPLSHPTSPPPHLPTLIFVINNNATNVLQILQLLNYMIYF